MRPGTGGAVAQEPSATPARARLRAHAHRARDPVAVSPTSTGFFFFLGLHPRSWTEGRAARARCLGGSTTHANEGRGGARPAAARSRVPGRATRGGAIVRWLLTHVPGFLSGEGGGGRGSGGGAGAGSGRRRWPPRGAAGPKSVPRLSHSVHFPLTTPILPPRPRRHGSRGFLGGAGDGVRLLPRPPA